MESPPFTAYKLRSVVCSANKNLKWSYFPLTHIDVIIFCAPAEVPEKIFGSANIPDIMTALNLYLSTCRYVMKADPNDQTTWTELYRFIPYLKQIFSCSVCGKILQNPKCPSHNVCQHHVCAGCLGGKMRLKPQCSWCRDTSVFVDSTTVRIMILCFSKLCDYIYNSPIGVELLSESSNNRPNSTERNNLLSVILELRQFRDHFEFPDISASCLFPPMTVSSPGNFKCSQKGKKTHLSNIKTDLCGKVLATPSPSPPVLTRFDTELTIKTVDEDHASTSFVNSKMDESNTCIDVVTVSPCDVESPNILDNGPPCLQKIRPSVPKKSKLRNFRPLLKNGTKKRHFHKLADLCSKKNKTKIIPFEPPCKRTRTANSMENGDRKICKCARNNKPNRLTCLGQRCPCYSEKRACVGCLCRGCRNPRRDLDSSDNLDTDTSLKESGFGLAVCSRN